MPCRSVRKPQDNLHPYVQHVSPASCSQNILEKNHSICLRRCTICKRPERALVLYVLRAAFVCDPLRFSHFFAGLFIVGDAGVSSSDYVASALRCLWQRPEKTVVQYVLRAGIVCDRLRLSPLFAGFLSLATLAFLRWLFLVGDAGPNERRKISPALYSQSCAAPLANDLRAHWCCTCG